MVVTLRAAHGRSEERGRNRPHPIRRRLGQILLRLGTAFAGHQVEAIKARRHELLRSRIRQQISRQLFANELVVRFVVVERLDDVVAIGKDVLALVAVETDRVGKSHHIQPRHRHALTVVRRTQQPIDQTLVGPGLVIGDKRGQLPRRGRQAGKVERNPSHQGRAVSFGTRVDPPFFQFAQDEIVDGVAHPRGGLDRGRCHALRRQVSPVRLVFGPLLDPAFNDRPVPDRDLMQRIRRRHDFERIVAGKSPPHLGLLRFAGHNPRDRATRFVDVRLDR